MWLLWWIAGIGTREKNKTKRREAERCLEKREERLVTYRQRRRESRDSRRNTRKACKWETDEGNKKWQKVEKKGLWQTKGIP